MVSESPTRTTCFLARVIATFILRFSDKNPTCRLAPERTMEITTTSFSLPWKPSTVLTSSSRAAAPNPQRSSSSFLRERSRLTCAEYGVMTPIEASGTPEEASRLTYFMITSASPGFRRLSPSSSRCSSMSHPAVSIKRSTGRWSSVASATSSAASSLPSYISFDDHAMIFSFIRYCVTSIWPIWDPWSAWRRSNSVTDSPLLAALLEIMVGGS
mmetsp:Transcript_312/g.810  ORF Transcript_312/g.810 Transcript_312/m.810 type:complete len:214 (-) Transcript_312:915-1556(-)